MRATCPDCLARAQAETAALTEAQARRDADASWVAKADRAASWGGPVIVCVLALIAVWAKSADDREAAARARAKSAATAAKLRTHAPEMVLIGGAP